MTRRVRRLEAEVAALRARLVVVEQQRTGLAVETAGMARVLDAITGPHVEADPVRAMPRPLVRPPADGAPNPPVEVPAWEQRVSGP